MSRPKSGYTLSDGTPVVGTTTITGQLPKPALVGWAGKTMQLAGVEHGKACYQAGQLGEPIPSLAKWTDVLYHQRDSAAEAGTAGHEASQAWLRGDDPEAAIAEFTEAAQEGGRKAFASFRKWWERGNYKLIDMEIPMVSETYQFGGTYDLLLQGPDGYELGDLKTGGTYPEHLLQIAAYGHLLQECRGIEVKGYHLLRITRDENPDFHHHYFDELSREWRCFERQLEQYKDMQFVTKRVK